MKKEDKFFKRWTNFLKAILLPIPLLSIFVSIFLIIISITHNDKKEFSVLMNLIGSVFLAIAGAFIKGGYDEMMAESVLVKKGQSAIRNLSSINKQVALVRSWINIFIKKEVGKKELKEVNRHLETTIMNINSGLADWIDIVPELKQTEEVARNYEDVIKVYIEELLKNKKELIGAGEDRKRKEQLESRIKELENNVNELRDQQSRVVNSGLSISSSPSSFSGSISPSGLSGFVNWNPLRKTCSNCGKTYEDESFSFATPGTLTNLCPECKKTIQTE